MGIGGSLRELAAFIDACEADGQVSAVELGAIEPAAEGRLTADVAVEFSLHPGDGAVELADTALGDDGRLELAFETTAPAIPTGAHDVTVQPASTTVAPDGTVTVTLTASVSTAQTDGRGERSADTATATNDANASNAADRTDATDAAAESDDETGAGAPAEARESRRRLAVAAGANGEAPGGSERRRSAGDVPPFEDRELLQQVYDEHDTFAEMPAALGMDVTAETVRRYMIDFGIHEPRSYDTSPGEEADGGNADDRPDEADGMTDTEESAVEESADEEAPDEEAPDEETPDEEAPDEERPVVLADGIGLPEEVTVDTIVETVRESNTIYEVTRDIGVDREGALELLRELDLLEFVVGRLATEAERSISRETVVDRLRQHADAQ